MDIIKVHKKDETYVYVECYNGVAQELSEYFSFFVPGYQYMPKFKSRMWDGKWRLFDYRSNLIYHGLIPYIEVFCKERGYKLCLDEATQSSVEFSVVEAEEFIDTLNLPYKVRDYQLEAFVKAIRNKRMLIMSPTGSGKSLIIYLIVRYLQRTMKKGLLVVPTISLVAQMYKDFEEYGFNSSEFCHQIHAGEDKNSDKFIYISTWQSIYNIKGNYFKQFDFVIGDEAHSFKAKSLTSILEKTNKASYRIGTTGTLDNLHTHKLVLEGIFGPVFKAISTSTLIENKQLSDFKIKCLILKYPEETCKMVKKLNYQGEIDYIVKSAPRNNFIKNLVLSLNGNTLVLFLFVEKHGKELFRVIEEKAVGRKVFFVSGSTDIEVREEVRRLTEKENNAIIVASYGVFAVGINIKNLDNLIFASPTKSRIRNLQSIGRVLRLSDSNKATLFDIVDDMRIGKHKNYTLTHFIERLRIYDEEKFKYKNYQIDFNG